MVTPEVVGSGWDYLAYRKSTADRLDDDFVVAVSS
jgi:hypothetical protein